ncbi:hypothetical protein CO018_02505 [Candidatus Beckwithbacteria bacterium CG_4_9_14_0_2_um_filter_47_11]|uniref:Uncharacterized protein n=1 Tax=Candidatus Beckwithbacteria bacterium CG_4_9_14_0_2_um_filter_47_11 TaxID=1974494 RepID=A0A2M8G3U4_9BACT|nr:MAG: hypothetical protein CO018_02505 [Candidatus Beckwithbacteria bacterium CG_4_9_14_0_2_um_filter_47_11]
MIYYKHYEFSQSLNGNKIFHIARNAAGTVVFREASEKKLKLAINNSLKPKPETVTKKPVTVSRLTKTADGKFISKNKLEKAEPPRKKNFWG